MEMVRARVRYRETYEREYDIEFHKGENAEKVFRYMIEEGRLDGPENCVDSEFEVVELEENTHE